MPNWCCTNYVLRGEPKDINRFCETVNACIDKPDVCENGFGKYWLGNLCVAFGYEYSESMRGLRGALNPDPDAIACFCYECEEPRPLEPELAPDNTRAQVRFSVVTAWGPSDWFHMMLDEKYPDVIVGFKTTDEFGNFHDCKSLSLLGAPAYEIEASGRDVWAEFDFGQEDLVAKKLTMLTGIDFSPEDVLYPASKVEDALGDYNESHEDDEVYFIAWKEVDY